MRLTIEIPDSLDAAKLAEIASEAAEQADIAVTNAFDDGDDERGWILETGAGLLARLAQAAKEEER